MASLKERLTELLINNKLITQEQLDAALAVQVKKGGKLSAIIVDLKFIKETELISVLSEGLGVPLIDLKRFKVDSEVAKIVPVDIARRYQIIPISKIGDTITLAMADPLNIFAIDHVGALTGYKINPIFSRANDISQAIEMSYPDTTKGVIDSLVKEMEVTSIEFVKEEKEVLPTEQELDRISHEPPVIKITNLILEEAINKRASDILIEPWDKKYS